ncbi:MAG: CoA pyrophosphatase [Pacificimonas sp.]
MNIAEVRRRLARFERGRVSDIASDEGFAPDEGDLKAAAVLIPLIDHPSDAGLLLTVRNAALSKHAGQVAFPGGRTDPGETAIEAALREAHEEVALSPQNVEVVAELDDYVTGTGYRVTPVIGVIPPDLKLRPSEAEVAEIFELPLAHAVDPVRQLRETGFWKGRERAYYAIDWKPQRVWGATAGMIVNLRRTLDALA